MVKIAKRKATNDRNDPFDNDPSPDDISERTAEIRKRWSPRVRRRRRTDAWNCVQTFEVPLQPRRKGFWGD